MTIKLMVLFKFVVKMSFPCQREGGEGVRNGKKVSAKTWMTPLKDYIPLYVSLFLKFIYDVSIKQVININKMKVNKKCTA